MTCHSRNNKLGSSFRAFLTPVAEYTRGNAPDNGAWFNVASDNSTGSDNRATTDVGTTEDDGTSTDPDICPDDGRKALFALLTNGNHGVRVDVIL